MDNDLPEFTAEEVNGLSNLARKNDYYKKCHNVVINYLDDKIKNIDKVKKWLWAIKKELKKVLKIK